MAHGKKSKIKKFVLWMHSQLISINLQEGMVIKGI
jgi:hypothetical protein